MSSLYKWTNAKLQHWFIEAKTDFQSRFVEVHMKIHGLATPLGNLWINLQINHRNFLKNNLDLKEMFAGVYELYQIKFSLIFKQILAKSNDAYLVNGGIVNVVRQGFSVFLAKIHCSKTLYFHLFFLLSIITLLLVC